VFHFYGDYFLTQNCCIFLESRSISAQFLYPIFWGLKIHESGCLKHKFTVRTLLKGPGKWETLFSVSRYHFKISAIQKKTRMLSNFEIPILGGRGHVSRKMFQKSIKGLGM